MIVSPTIFKGGNARNDVENYITARYVIYTASGCTLAQRTEMYFSNINTFTILRARGKQKLIQA